MYTLISTNQISLLFDSTNQIYPSLHFQIIVGTFGMVTLRVTLLYVLALTVIPAASQETAKSPTIHLNVGNFQEQITTHELSVVAFYTKHSRFTSLLSAIFANLTEAYKNNDKLLVGLVNIDENVELTTYTDHNMIDIMIFYPEFLLNPLRYSRNFTTAAIKDEVDYCWQVFVL